GPPRVSRLTSHQIVPSVELRSSRVAMLPEAVEEPSPWKSREWSLSEPLPRLSGLLASLIKPRNASKHRHVPCPICNPPEDVDSLNHNSSYSTVVTGAQS